MSEHAPLRATFLGTGSAIPTGERTQSGVLVERDDDALLVDCGSGVLESLARTDVAPADLDAVCLTHHHLDHASDLLALAKARWLTDADESLPVVGPPGTRDLLADLLDAFDYLRGRVRVTARDVEDDVTVAGFDVDVHETHHSDSLRSYAYRVDDSLTVSGDTPADPGLAAFAADTTLVHDCSFPDDVESDAHATPSALGRALAGHDYPAVYLTHLYPAADARGTELAAAVRDAYGAPLDVSVAADGDAFTVV